MQANEGEDETLQVLHKVVEASQAVGVFAVVDVHEGADLGRGEGDVLVADHDLQLLTADAIGLGPGCVVLVHDFRVLDDPPQLVHDGLVDVGLLADHGVVLVVRVVGVPFE